MSEFSFVPVPIGRYEQPTFPALDADDQAARIADLVEEIGGSEEHWEPGPRDHSAVAGRLRQWSNPPAPRSSMLYWAGHGQALGPKAWLAVEDTPDPMTVNAVNPESFAEYVIEEWRHRSLDEEAWALVVVEACGARRFVEILLSRLYDEGGMDRLAVIGVGGYGSGYLGTFRQVLSDALAGYSDNDDAIHLRDLVGRVQDRLGDQGMVADLGLYQAPPLPRRRRSTGRVTAPLDVYAELRDFVATLTPDERGHFLPKAQGAEQGELAWYFMGRRQEGARIAEWLHTATQGMLVVTGEAGSGKSALLGNVVVQANPELSALLARAGMTDGTEGAVLPPPHVFDAVLHLTGATTGDVVRQLAGDESIEDAEELAARLSDREAPFTVLVDALDEAQDPLTVARELLAPIAGIDGVRVLVGTRSSTKEGPDSPAGEDRDILDALGEPSLCVKVGRDSAAADEYVRRRLLAGIPTIAPAELDAVREEIASRERHFLYARLAVHELMARPELLEPTHRDQRAELLAHDYRALFAAAVRRLGDRDPAFAPLLEALALGQGRGLPRTDGVWQIAARALDGTAAIDEESVDALLADAAPYVMLDAEHGQSVYRLAHRTFQEHYFAARAPELPFRHRLIARGLSESADEVLPSTPNPYVVHHLPGHVAAADDWAFLVSRPRLLDHLAPGAVAAQAARPRPGSPPLPGAISAIRAAHHRLEAVRPSERGSLRAIAEAQFTGRLPDPETWHSPDARWVPLWADFERLRSPTTSVFTLDCGKLTALTALRWGDGRTVVALAEDKPCRVHFWDPVAQSRIGEPLNVPKLTTVRLAAVPAEDERDHLAVGGRNGLEIWDPRTRTRVDGLPTGPDFVLQDLSAVRTRDGRLLLAHALLVEGRIHFWEPGSRRVTSVDMRNNVGSFVALPGEDGSDRLVVASQFSSTPIPRKVDVREAPVDVVVMGGEAESMTPVPGEPDRVLLTPLSVGRRPVSVWEAKRGSTTELPIMVDLAYRGDFTLVRGSDGELLLISLTGHDREVTVEVVGPDALRSESGAGPRHSTVSVHAVHLPGQGDAFAVCSRGGEFGFRSVATGAPLGERTGNTRQVMGPPGGPLLINSRDEELWTEREGRRPLPEAGPYPPGSVPFLSSDGRLLLAQFDLRGNRRKIVCHEVPREREKWRVDCQVRPGDIGNPTQIRSLHKPGGGALIVAHYWDHPIVVDHDHPKDVWILTEVSTSYHKGAAVLDLPGPVLAVCDDYQVMLWDYPSRRRIATLGHHDHNDIIADLAVLHAGTGDRRRPVLAVAYVDGFLRLWDPLRPAGPLAALALDMAPEAIAASGTRICLVNDEGVLCVDVGGLVPDAESGPARPRPSVPALSAVHRPPLLTRLRTHMRRGRR